MHFRTLLLLAIALACATPASARFPQNPCNAWDASFAPAGPDLPFEDFIEFDDGSGLALYAAGSFRSIGTRPVRGVARWDGVQWNQVGAGLPNVSRLAVFDDGSGSRLYAAGSFRIAQGAPANTIARWNGASWEPLAGSGPTGVLAQVTALEVFDDGSGPALYLAGGVSMPSPPQPQRAVRWNGTAWSSVQAGIASGEIPSSLAVFDAGSGPSLYLGIGQGAYLVRVRRWNGSSWVPAWTATSSGGQVQSLAAYTGAGSPALYAAGRFGTGPVSYDGIARFDGTTWSTVGTGLIHSNPISVEGQALAVHDDGSGPRLHVAGTFELAGGVPVDGFASWDGSTWRAIQPGFPPMHGQRVQALASFDDGAGRALFVGGAFSRIGRTPAAHAAVLRQGIWHRFADGGGIGAAIRGLHVFDDGSGPALYASGGFDTAGTAVAHVIARWDGTSWSPLGADLTTDEVVNAMIGFDAGTGPQLYAAGFFTQIGGVVTPRVARFDGTSWHALGSGLANGDVAYAETLAVFDDGTGPALYVGGQFSSAGGVQASNIARWDGASWSALGLGTNFLVRDLAVHDDGSGAALYVCGNFTMAGGMSVPGIARWNGTSWSTVGIGTLVSAGQLLDMQVFDDGGGAHLYLSGAANLANPSVQASVARWNGTSWTAAATTGFQVGRFAVFHDGIAPRLCATDTAPSSGSSTIRTYDGSQWSALPGFLEGYVGILETADLDTDGVPELYAGGAFRRAGDQPAWNVARFVSCGTQGEIVCPGDGTGTACPCGNSGATGHGCASSVYASGAQLTNGGVASITADTLVLAADAVTGSSAIYAQGTSVAGGNGVPFDDGLRCVGGSVTRLGSAPIVGGASSFPQAGGTRLSQLGLVTSPGQVRVYQAVYRNAASFCTSGSSNTTNGLRVIWSL